VRLTVCGLVRAVCFMVNFPMRLPFCVGLKVTLMAQCFPVARLAGQLWLSAKSPLATMLTMCNVAAPRLLSVTGLRFAGGANLAAIETDAKAKGYNLVARRAATP
jgi:hypothetical protein